MAFIYIPPEPKIFRRVRGYQINIYEDKICFDNEIIHLDGNEEVSPIEQQIDSLISYILSKELSYLMDRGHTRGK